MPIRLFIKYKYILLNDFIKLGLTNSETWIII